MTVAVAGMTDRIERPPRARVDLARVAALIALLAPAVALLGIGLVWPFLMMLTIRGEITARNTRCFQRECDRARNQATG